MVVFVDYEQDSPPNSPNREAHDNGRTIVYNNQFPSNHVAGIASNIAFFWPNYTTRRVKEQLYDNRVEGEKEEGDELAASNVLSNALGVRVNNINSFSIALSCYPVVKELAKSVDLNTLDALSRTCHEFRENLLVFRHQLIKLTLRCENEYMRSIYQKLLAGEAVPDDVKQLFDSTTQDNPRWPLLTSNKGAKCARDMVEGCRRCSRIVCRNCIAKPPSDSRLKHRLRRLCISCRKAPFAYHLSALKETDTKRPLLEIPLHPTFTALAFSRTPCQCEQIAWLCEECGQNLRNNDTSYRRVWMWRTRYSSFLGGGLGTGIGEGSQGVKCGRGEACLAAQEIEVELDCEAEESNDHPYENDVLHLPHNFQQEQQHPQEHYPGVHDGQDDSPGYLRQEIVGIGGVVKQKVKKRVILGACVVEHEDEREKGTYLRREETGQHRSWCSWCWRVVPSTKDLQERLLC